MDPIVKTIETERVIQGWGKKALADESGIGHNTYSLIHAGRVSPRLSTLRALMDTLNLEVSLHRRDRQG